jgi:hypothetical protein
MAGWRWEASPGGDVIGEHKMLLMLAGVREEEGVVCGVSMKGSKSGVQSEANGAIGTAMHDDANVKFLTMCGCIQTL